MAITLMGGGGRGKALMAWQLAGELFLRLPYVLNSKRYPQLLSHFCMLHFEVCILKILFLIPSRRDDV